MKIISIIVPVYKVPLEYLRTCLDSLNTQTMQECEFIIVSDGAPEAECAICEKYAKKDSRFKFFKREHAGVSATRNYGIVQAQGEYITFVDCDDWLSLNALTTIKKLIKLNDFDIALMNSIKSWDSDNNKIILKLNNETTTINLKKIPHFAICGYIFKQSIIKQHKICFNESLTLSEDKAFIYHYCCFSKILKTTNEPEYFYRQHNSSVCHQKNTIQTVIQQIKAAKHIANILKEHSNVSNFFIFHLTNKMIQMAIIGFTKYKHNKKEAHTIYQAYKSIFKGSSLRYTYIWYRAKLAILLGHFFHI